MSSVERKQKKSGGTLGQRVYAQRLGKGLTQGELAALTGLSAGHISEIENGIKENLQHKTLQKLAKGLGMSLMELLGEDDNA